MAAGRKTGGRTAGTPNKATAELRAFAGRYTIDAIKGLLSIAQDVEMPPQARVGAWREILDRAVGKAPQALTDADGGNLSVPTSVTFVVDRIPNSGNKT